MLPFLFCLTNREQAFVSIASEQVGTAMMMIMMMMMMMMMMILLLLITLAPGRLQPLRPRLLQREHRVR